MTREYRFNIRLLANRLAVVTDWLLTKNHETQNASFSIDYFGSSSGAAAALIAAAERHAGSAEVVKAIVSRGGRPDMANSSQLKRVQASTLFLVSSRDNPQVIVLNQKASQQLKNAKEKRLSYIANRIVNHITSLRLSYPKSLKR